VEVYREALIPQNAKDIITPYDIVLDCTDNAPTRYLLSDTTAVLSKPLVSGAAMRYDGQLCTYNLPNGPCYRCIFPKPPSPEIVGTCEGSGVLGVVTGTIGTLQALAAIKFIIGQHGTLCLFYNNRELTILDKEERASLLLFSALGFPPFRSVKIRSKSIKCPICNPNGKETIPIEETDYVAFCGGNAPDWEARGLVAGEPGTRISVKVFQFHESAISNVLYTSGSERSTS
jgi:adenylyltransferase/sulfurtransferase